MTGPDGEETGGESGEPRFEIAIIGGGPAGLTAAIWSARYLHSVLVVDSGDPRNWDTQGVNGLLGLDGIQPPELRRRGRETCRALGVSLVDEEVLRIDPRDNEKFTISIRGGRRIAARRLLLAIGVRDVWPDVAGLRPAYGVNAHVCPDCDGYDARNKRVAIIGNGRRAVGMALNLTTWTSNIVICTNGRPAELDDPEYCEKLDALGIPVLTAPIAEVCCEGSEIRCLRLDNGTRFEVDKIFFTLAQYPADDLGVQLGCARDHEGHIEVDARGQTSVENVFAAGDVTPGPQIVPKAEAQGAIAALAMHKSLVPAARSLTPRQPTNATR
ncbi:MAG TPA: NAD(P)/FAD-dependent oxidoreductase [Gemmatimonadaceae bacterium]|jgi:thioredoxin reductase|nr:NAD(P)/FAD-dependent oxidoreductase [Gemmatimonadaceae bacterium]